MSRPHCHPELFGKVSERNVVLPPLSPELSSFFLRQLPQRRSTEHFPIGSGICQPRFHSFCDQRTLKLSNRSDHLKHQLTSWQRGINRLCNGNKINSQRTGTTRVRRSAHSGFWRNGRISTLPPRPPIPVDSLSVVRSVQVAGHSIPSVLDRGRSSGSSNRDAGRILAVPVPALACPARSCSL